MRRYIFLTVLCALFAGCCTCKPTPAVNDRDSTGWHTEWRTDTVREIDSVFVSVKEKGDTIRITEYRYKYRYLTHEVEVHDTVTVTQTETVTQTVEVEKPRKWWEMLAQAVGILTLTLGTIIGLWVLVKHWVNTRFRLH